MKLKLNKKKLKNLSKDQKSLPADMTPQVAGGGPITDEPICGMSGGGWWCTRTICL
ncbi:hypothetical protein [Pseudoalteromonas denitrificans]|jgi:hypothetical protein|uniref:Uncharacterized protein n=1 Tax=Pseudoalteromonas denitrificans DSM 6059 TaxID=1123010 RepID=A0A1I1N491_9GAMM|nr:hypothetical protein [Pseudoalteromonas denitrificans]SFC92012.1 hypothetical protein SAMN02745724_02916 [Pseudoalteromonas denitrificans DSM 6059]